MSWKPRLFVLDVDGVMTTGQFYYTTEGKVMKVFGPDDNDGLSLLKPYLEIQFVTGDRKGYEISRKRIQDDMGFEINLVSTVRRAEWLSERWDLNDVIYMGDGILDHLVFQKIPYGIAPANADANAKRFASYVTERSGGDRAVAEACLHILEKFFEPFDTGTPPVVGTNMSGEWTV